MLHIISVTGKGDSLGYKLIDKMDGKLYLKSKLKEELQMELLMRDIFRKDNEIIFISSTGVAVRYISKFITSKDKDPAVVVVDVCNNFTISLLSGHLGGANELTKKVAKILGNQPIITTATDNMGIKAPDLIAKENGLIIDDLLMAKGLANRLVNEQVVYFKDDLELIKCPIGYTITDELRENALWITNKRESRKNVLKLIKRNIVVGIGCRRGVSYEALINFLEEILEENNIDIRSIRNIGSIDIKRDEVAINALSKKLNINPLFFEKDEITNIQDKYLGSEFVLSKVGVKSVCEPVVELMNGEIIVNKVAKSGITIAIGIVQQEEY